MKKALFTVLFVALLQVPAFARDTKIGVLNMEAYSLQSEPGKYVQQQMKQVLDPKINEIKRLQDALNQMKEDYIKQSSAFSLDVQNSKKLELKRKARDLEDMKIEFTRFAKTEEARITKPAQDLMEKVAKRYAADNNYDLVLEQRMSGILYFNEQALDITPACIEAVDKAWKAQGGAAGLK